MRDEFSKAHSEHIRLCFSSADPGRHIHTYNGIYAGQTLTPELNYGIDYSLNNPPLCVTKEAKKEDGKTLSKH